MPIRHLLFVLLGLLLSALRAEARQSTPCEGRFLLDPGVALLDGVLPGARDAVSVAGRLVGVDSGCGARKAKVTATAKATRLAVRWPSCGSRRNVRLKALIAASACDQMKGSVVAKQMPRRSFAGAPRSRCGDGYDDVGGGETCDAQAQTGTGADATFEQLAAANTALASGATDVPLSPDGTLRFRRTVAGATTTDEIARSGTILARWVHAGDGTTITVDRTGDGVPEIAVQVARTPVRSAVVTFDDDGDGTPERTESLTQVGDDGLQVEITEGGAPTSFSTTLLQAVGATPRAVTGEGCTSQELSTATSVLSSATTTGLQCLRSQGLEQIARLIEGKIARDGVKFRCGATNDCAQVDVLDSLTRGAVPLELGVNLGADFFTGAGACADPQLVLFHELLHLGLGAAHSPFLDRSTFQGLGDDRVYSCADLCFRPTKVRKCECAKCLGVDRCDPKCAAYPDCENDPPCTEAVAITGKSCPSTACECCSGNFSFCKGVRPVIRMEGTASAPVGGFLRVNFTKAFGGEIQCPDWTPTSCQAGTDLLCCTRTSAQQPQQTTFVATQPLTPGVACICPTPPASPVNLVAQAGREVYQGAVVEADDTVTCPQ